MIFTIFGGNRAGRFGGVDGSGEIRYIPCNAASRPTVIDKDQPIKSLGSMSRDKVSTARLHLKMVFAHGPTLVGR